MRLVRTFLRSQLSCFDDKRYLLDDGINTLAYFVSLIKTMSSIRVTRSIEMMRIIKIDKNDKFNKD